MSISPGNQVGRPSGASALQNGDGSDRGSESEEEVFEVEAILEEKRIMGVTKYLVKWAGYDLMNATWEPAEQFDSSDTLMDWARKKPLIEAERERRFDVKRWERDQKRIQAKFESSGKDLIADNATLNTDFDSYFIPLPVPANISPPLPANNVRNRRESRLSISSDVSSLFVSAETVSPGQLPAPDPVLQKNPIKPASGASQPAQDTSTRAQAVKESGAIARTAPKVVPQRADNQPANQAEYQAPNRTGRKSQQAKPALITSNPKSRPQVPPVKSSLFQPGQTARLSHKRPGSDSRRSGQERVPDISQLELLKPSEFPSRENYGHLSITNKPGVGNQLPGKLPSDASEPVSTALAPTDSPSSFLSTGATQSETPSEIQAPDTTFRPIRPPPTMPKADRLSLRDRSPDRVNPAKLPDFAKRPIASAGNIRRRSTEASHQKAPSVYSRRESPGASSSRRRSPDLSSRRRSLDPDSRRRSPDPLSRRGPLDPFRAGGDCYRPGERDMDPYRPSDSGRRNEQMRSSGTVLSTLPSDRSPAVKSPNVTTTSGHQYYEIARRNPVSSEDRDLMPPPVTVPRSFNQSGLSRSDEEMSPVIAPGPSNQPVISAEEKGQIAQMPLGIPDDTVCFVKNGYFYNQGDHEVLAHVYFGVDKKYIGPVRLCGHRVAAKYDLLRYGDPREMWFKDMCTMEEYEELSRDIKVPPRWCNAWMEGFEDTNEALFLMGERLRTEKKVAIYYSANIRGLSWIAYSPSSSFYRRLTHFSCGMPDGAAICLTVTGPLLDFSTLSTRSSRPGQSYASVNVPSKFDVNQASLHSSSIIQPERRPWVLTELNRTDTRFSDETLHDGGNAPLDTPNGPFADGGLISVPSPPHVQEPVVLSRKVGGINKDTANSTAIGIAQMLTFFSTNLKVTVKTLATLNNGSIADMFYLHFPVEDKDASDELQLMELWLEQHKARCWTSRDPRSWERFQANCKRGVVIFHESFFEYDSLRPKIRSFQWKDDFNFWSVRLNRPLDSPDHRLLSKSPYIQRLFPSGTAILLTEDLFLDMKRAAMIVCWFYHKHCISPGTSKLVLWPDAMTELEKRLDDPLRNKDDDPYILSIIICIKTVNSVDPNFPLFEPNSLSIQHLDSLNNNVLCLPVVGYGQRTGAEHPDIPKGLTQDERNADHLVEAFAGWMLMNATRFRRMAVISDQRNEALLLRWSAWGHLTILGGFKGFCKAYNTDEAVLHDRLQNGLQRNVNSPQITAEANPLTTPRTPQTPQESQDPCEPRRESRDPRLRKLKDTNPNAGPVQPYR
ncbi:uncharacterized protein N7503_009130 [Penicillium pulvis]|uniref:uncharacterized protein n=1 Tax=Penicillium pulvis TaxID=1562058 RepID=UPI00254680B1|nr:uncharacterized protein N7503_009130 [Penicillium pulvis]KAJ5793152.1 hypothetical protein N7503_009130 [Penicillium pulvis]